MSRVIGAIVGMVLGAATLLATIDGSVEAITWACDTLGSRAVETAAAFFAGVVLTTACRLDRRSETQDDGPPPLRNPSGAR